MFPIRWNILAFGLVLMLLAACGQGPANDIGPAVKGIPRKIVRAVPPKPRQDFHTIVPRRWVAEHGYFETVYQQALERGTRSDVLVSPDGRYVAIFQQQDVLFLSTETGEVAHRLLGAYASVRGSKFSYDGRYFVAYLGRVDPTLKRGPGPNQINTTNDRLMIRIDLAEGFARKIFFPNEEMCRLFPDDCKKVREFDFLNKDIGLSDYEIDLISIIDGEDNFYLYNYVTGMAHKLKNDYIDPINSVRISEMKIPKKHKYINAKTVLEPDEVIGDARANCIGGGFSDRVYVDCGSLTFPEGRYKYFIMTYDYAQKKNGLCLCRRVPICWSVWSSFNRC